MVDITFVSRRSFTITVVMKRYYFSLLHTVAFHSVLLIQFSEPFSSDDVEKSDGNV